MEISIDMIIVIVLVMLILIIAWQYYFNKTDRFETHNSVKTNSEGEIKCAVAVFLSDSCPHCVNYDKNIHNSLSESLSKLNIKITKIYSNNDPDNLFEKFNIEYVPTVYVLKDNNNKLVTGPSSVQNILKTLQTM